MYPFRTWIRRNAEPDIAPGVGDKPVGARSDVLRSLPASSTLARIQVMSPPDRRAYWRFDRDETSRVSTESTADRQPESDAHSPVRGERQRGGHPNPAVLRSAIDKGRAGDKVAHPDPAAAPLGTDDEAARTPATPERVATAMRHEIRAPETNEQRTSAGSHGVILTLVVAAAAALAIAVLTMAA